MINLTLDSGIGVLLPLIASYKFMSISSKTNANLPEGSSYNTSRSGIIFACGDNRFNAYISHKLLTFSILENLAFIHLIAND